MSYLLFVSQFIKFDKRSLRSLDDPSGNLNYFFFTFNKVYRTDRLSKGGEPVTKAYKIHPKAQ